MSQIVEREKDFVKKRQMERLLANMEMQAGILDYIAMMANVEIPAGLEGNYVV